MRPPRLATVLLLGNLTVLALPVAGFWGLRLYESALVRQTETELVAQAAVLAGAMRERLLVTSAPAPGLFAPGLAAPGLPAPDLPAPGSSTHGPIGPAAAALHLARRPRLDLASDPVLPPQPEAVSAGPADPALAAAGHALTPVLRDAQAVTLASMRLLDRAGVIVGTTGTDLGLSLAAWPEVGAVLAGAPIGVAMHRRSPAQDVPGGFSRTAGLRVFVALPVMDAAGAVLGAAVLSRTPNTLSSAISGKAIELAELAVLLLAAGGAIAAGVSRLVTRPLAAVVDQARAVAAGGRMTPLARPGTREVEALSVAVARMEATLAERAGYISGFAASVSHEFKTPMAAIRGASELLEDHAETLLTAERDRLLRLMGDGVRRLDQLVGGLLDMARADMMRAAPETGPGTALQAVLDRVAARHIDLDLTVADAGDARVRVRPEALEAVLTSLLENAAVHAPGAAVRVEVRPEVRPKAGGIVVVVADDGPGIPADDHARVFEPFFTTARGTGGTGLGLPVARALLASGGGTITLLPGPGTRFQLLLPAS